MFRQKIGTSRENNMDLILIPFRLEFREFCIGLALRQIDDIFQMSAGILVI